MIEMKNVSKYYGNFRALNNISISVDKGEILGLLGPNGAGKTTAMRILTCFLPASEGTVSVAGYDVFEDSLEVRRRLGYLPETPPLYHEMTVSSYLDFVGDIKELPGKIKQKRIHEVVERIGLTENFNRIIGTLSKGYRQRVGLAQALLHDPEVLILDEPTVGLDPNQIIEIRELVKDLSSDHTIVLSTHILSEVRMTCKRVVIINEGELVTSDSVENLEKAATGKPIWNLEVKAETDAWKKAGEGLTGFQISNLSTVEGIQKCELSLEKEADFDAFFTKSTETGAIFRKISPVKASLEDVFIQLTTNGEEE